MPPWCAAVTTEPLSRSLPSPLASWRRPLKSSKGNIYVQISGEVYWCMISTGTHDSNCVLSPLCLCWHHSLIQVIISLLYLSEEVASIQLHGLKKELILKKEDNKIHWKHSILLLTCQTALNNCLVLWIMRQIYGPPLPPVTNQGLNLLITRLGSALSKLLINFNI